MTLVAFFTRLKLDGKSQRMTLAQHVCYTTKMPKDIKWPLVMQQPLDDHCESQIVHRYH